MEGDEESRRRKRTKAKVKSEREKSGARWPRSEAVAVVMVCCDVLSNSWEYVWRDGRSEVGGR
jgi:hypothetical protein